MTDLDRTALDELDDFDSEDLEDVEDADDEYLRGMWSRYDFGSRDVSENLVIAHGMVQSFVNAFARDGAYIVGFDPNVSTAGTDMKARRVVITPAPVLDPTLDPADIGKILTGLAVHEISHPRYGKQTAKAVEKVFPSNPVAFRLSNLLDDVRIERRFVADYPGYAGVFAPTLAYVGEASCKNGKSPASMSRLVDLAISAIRYPSYTIWDETTSAEAAWWTDWADRGSKEDSPKRHVDFIREALARIVAAKAPKPQPSQTQQQGPAAGNAPQGGEDKDPSDATGTTESAPAPKADATHDEPKDEAPQASSASDDEPAPEAPEAPTLSDQDLDNATRFDRDERVGKSSCAGSTAVEGAATTNGTDARDVSQLRTQADRIIEAARNLEEDGHGAQVDVAKSLKGLTHGGPKLGPSSMASRYIRNVILRSRTGNTDVSQHQKRGRLDSHGLARVGYGDTRIFEKRTAPSPGRYLIYVMVDASGSMGWGSELAQAAQVAHAMASATQGTPTVRMEVYAWSDPFRPSPAYAGVARVWRTGDDTDQIFRMSGLHKGGTPDAPCLSWAARSAKRNARQDEQPVVIMISDGQGDSHMAEWVAEARDAGVIVAGVSFGRSLDAKALEARYGRHGFVEYAGSIIATARPLAELFGRITSGKLGRR